MTYGGCNMGHIENIFIDEWYEPICNEIDSLIHFPIEYFKFNTDCLPHPSKLDILS